MNHFDEIQVTVRNKGIDMVFKTTNYSNGGGRKTKFTRVRIGMRGGLTLLHYLLGVFKDKVVPRP